MAEIRGRTVVVCDAGPIIHLDELGCLHLMRDFEKVLVPDSVQEEVLKHRPVGFEDADVTWIVVPPSFPVEEPVRTMCRIFSLDAGEVAALGILTNQPGSVFLTDDSAARLVATRLGYRVHGTIGVLIRAIRRDLMSPKEAVEALNRIPSESSLYIRLPLLREVISSVTREYGQ